VVFDVRLTRAGEYAIRCVSFLATLKPSELANRSQVAEEMDIPSHFLAKIAQQLQKDGIIHIAQGARGGLRLARPAAEISMLDVVEAVMGTISLNDCVLHPGSCDRSSRCAIHQVWQTATDQLRATLASASFDTHCMTV
jgi:Rrf2 family iron-sulfur cluster assembly transcriptional regulator